MVNYYPAMLNLLLKGLLQPQFLELTRQANYIEREAFLLELLTGGIAP
jgi:hypothetical protein